MQKVIYCRWSQSLGDLESTHQKVWGTKEYKWWRDRKKPTVFFGLYDLRDYLALSTHKQLGKPFVLWAGSDILNLSNGFVFNNGKLKWLSVLMPNILGWWLRGMLRKAEHWVENEKEREALTRCGVRVTGVCPSFLGDLTKFKVSYKHSPRPHVYLSSGQGRQLEYGWGIIERIAKKLPNITFHLYGADWKTENDNVVVHGRVSKERMNRDIKNMQAGLRLNGFDGFSEIVAKGMLMGQYIISEIGYPHALVYETEKDLIRLLNGLKHKKKPNLNGRKWAMSNINKFPWVK